MLAADHCRSIATIASLALMLAGCGELTNDSEQASTKPGAPMALAGSGAGSGAGSPAPAAAIDFGDDNGEWANDGECDDKRFAGAGMTATPLLEADIKHDASDCRSAFDQGRITLASASTGKSTSTNAATEALRIQWGDDNGQWANDGECDDQRFTGAGMTSTPLLEADIKHDASDCRAAFEQGRLQLK